MVCWQAAAQQHWPVVLEKKIVSISTCHLFPALTVDKPSFTGDQLGYASFLAYEGMKNVNFEFDMKFKFSIGEEEAKTLKSSLLVYSGEKSGELIYFSANH